MLQNNQTMASLCLLLQALTKGMGVFAKVVGTWDVSHLLTHLGVSKILCYIFRGEDFYLCDCSLRFLGLKHHSFYAKVRLRLCVSGVLGQY